MTFEEWWSQALSMHDIPIDPNDICCDNLKMSRNK